LDDYVIMVLLCIHVGIDSLIKKIDKKRKNTRNDYNIVQIISISNLLFINIDNSNYSNN